MSEIATRFPARFPVILGFSTIFLMLSGLGAWSVGTRIAGAVVASGTIDVDTERQVVQHSDGGVVDEIFFRDGDHVEAGDILLRFDGTFLQSELAIVEGQLAEFFVRSARLIAERDEADEPDFSGSFSFRTVAPETFAELVEGQRHLFFERRSALEQEQQQIREQQRQIERRIEGMEAQSIALQLQRDLVSSELEDLERLLDRGLVEGARISNLLREDARLQGDIANLAAMAAEAETRIAELSIESVRLVGQVREQAITQLRDLDYSEMGLLERRLGLHERIARLDVRAPVSGTVLSSSVAAERSVVRPADPMMYIVPRDRPFQVSARIEPMDIDQVSVGQTVTLLFTAFSSKTTPEISGVVQRVSADAVRDDATGISYYRAIIVPDEVALAESDGLVLRPGMPVEAFFKTEERTPLSYLTQPLIVYFQRAFREE